jgi:hypothetical protein
MSGCLEYTKKFSDICMGVYAPEYYFYPVFCASENIRADFPLFSERKGRYCLAKRERGGESGGGRSPML